jgi:hypothetical protein
MKTKLALLILSVSSVITTSAFAGDVKPLHTVAQMTNKTLPATAGQICDVYRLSVPAGDTAKSYTSANVIDLASVAKPKLGVKVGKWNGSDCVAVSGAEGQTFAMHVTNGGVAYDEGTGTNGCAATADQWPLTTAGASPVADGNGLKSKYSTMNNTTTNYCVQVCKYSSSQHTGTLPTDAAAETYTVDAHTHNAATISTVTSGHCSANHSAPVFVSQLCNDTAFASCAYSF